MRVVPPMTLRSRSLCKSIGAEAFVHIRIMKGRGEKKMANDKKTCRSDYFYGRRFRPVVYGCGEEGRAD